jgi:hypothetical protein
MEDHPSRAIFDIGAIFAVSSEDGAWSAHLRKKPQIGEAN